ncbi:MAG: hypothetical protein WBP29_04935 [Candidatus Zixiibacteriota bacterium]
MKKSTQILSVLTIAVLALCSLALAKKEKVGTVENGWYSDSRFGFSLNIAPEWKTAGLKDEPSPERVMFEWRKPRVPLKLKSSPNDALRPFVRIFADSTTLGPVEFLDSLNVGSTKDSFRDKILSKSTFFERGKSNPPEISTALTVMIGGHRAYQWSIRREYSVQIQKDNITPPELVRDYRFGYVYIVPADGWLLYLEMACENQFRDDLDLEFQKVASSITFRNAAPATDSVKTIEGGKE